MKKDCRAAWLATVSFCAAMLTTQAPTNAAATFPLAVKVLDAEGHPIRGALVEQYQFNYHFGYPEPLEPAARLQTDAAGSAELRVSQGVVLLIAKKDGLAAAWRQFPAAPGADQRVVLMPPSVLAGVVVEEGDRPVPDAEVAVVMALSESPQGNGRQFNYLSGKVASDLFRARTDANGRFRIRGFPTDASADLVVNAPGKSVRQTAREHIGPGTMQWRAGQEDIRLVLDPAGSIEGRILMAGSSSAALPIADLRLQPSGPGSFALFQRPPDRSGADGRFRMADVPAGSYRLAATFGTNTPPEWVAESVAVTVEKGGVTRDVSLAAIRGGLVEVKLQSRGEGKPLAGVNVNAYQQFNGTAAVSSSNGLAVLRVPPGEYQVTAFGPGLRMENASATVTDGQTNRLEFELAPAPRIRGTVRGPEGQPAAGLAVQIIGDHSMQQANIRTGPDGTFETEWNPQRFGNHEQTFCLLVRDPGRNLAVAQDIDEETGALELRLAPGMTLAGRAECEGQPIPNATAALVFWTGNSGMHLTGLSATNLQPGQFEIPAVPPGRRYGLYVSAPGFGQQYINLGETEPEPRRVEVEPVELRVANLKLSGKVVDAEEKPVAGAYIHLAGEGQPNANALTDREGRFRFESVCEGVARLSANSGNSHGSVTAQAGETNIVLTLGESFASMPNIKLQKIKGTVTGPEKQPIPGALVMLVPSFMPSSTKTDAKGEFNLTWRLEPWQRQMGNTMLIIRAIDQNLALAEELFDDTTNVTVQLKPALTITGRVQKADGSPLPQAEVGIWMQTGRSRTPLDSQPARADPAGQFRLAGLPSDQDYTVYAQAKGYGRSEQPVIVEPDAHQAELESFALKPADRMVSGQVLNPNDKPAVGVHISFSGDDQPNGSTTTDGKGRFKIQVCEGSVRLFAGNEAGHANTTVEGGDTNVLLQLEAPRTRSAPGAGAQRAPLNGKTVDLASVGLPAEAAPAGKLILVCLVDIEQRGSRRLVQSLTDEKELPPYNELSIVAVNVPASTAEKLKEWKEQDAVPFATGQVAERSDKTRWAHAVESFPWLILIDTKGRVAAEGFSFDELEDRIEETRPETR